MGLRLQPHIAHTGAMHMSITLPMATKKIIAIVPFVIMNQLPAYICCRCVTRVSMCGQTPWKWHGNDGHL